MSWSTPSTPPLTPSLAMSLPPFSTTSIARLQALYSDFSRQKQSNPTSYHANVEWWRIALEALVSSGKQGDRIQLRVEDGCNDCDRLVLHAGRDLIEQVKIPRVGKPLALGSVLSELQGAHHSFLYLPLFINSKTSVYDPGWLPVRIAKALVGRPLWWALEQLGIVGEEGILGSVMSNTGPGHRGTRPQERDTSWWGDYVLLSLVERAADKVMERQERKVMGSKADRLYTYEEFRTSFGGVAGGGEEEPLRDLDAKVLVKYLERDRSVISVDEQVIKFIDQSAPFEEQTVTAVDCGILELKTAVGKLHAQVDSLQKKIDECTEKAKAALLQQRKPVALGYLRSRKHLEDVLHKRLSSLNTLESTFITVEAAAGDVEIMKTYESSTATLRAILAHPSLQRSKIDETMEALAEANTDAREIDEAIRVGADVAIGVSEAVDDGELEEEWKAMIREADAETVKLEEDKRRKMEEVSAIPNDIIVENKSPEREGIAAS